MIDTKVDHEPIGNNKRSSIDCKENISPLRWDEIHSCSNKICVAYHISVEIENYIYIHGGIKDKKLLKPTNDFYRIDINTFAIENLTSGSSPSLSQHAGVVLEKRYLVIIGGWNGHSRISSVHVFDSKIMNWLKTPISSGFSEKAGLSGHTVNASIKTSGLFPEIIVIGREGSIKTQRRYGNGYRLSCNSDLSRFTYSDLGVNLDSRSCHCATVVNKKFLIVGGRDDNLIDIHKFKDLIPSLHCNAISNMIERIHQFNFKKCPTGRKAARRGHCLISGKNGFVVLGGTSFINTSHKADSSAFLFVDRSESDTEYYFLGLIENSRTDGACCVTSCGDAYYHGGIGSDGMIRSELLKLNFAE